MAMPSPGLRQRQDQRGYSAAAVAGAAAAWWTRPPLLDTSSSWRSSRLSRDTPRTTYYVCGYVPPTSRLSGSGDCGSVEAQPPILSCASLARSFGVSVGAPWLAHDGLVVAAPSPPLPGSAPLAGETRASCTGLWSAPIVVGV